MSDLPLTKYDAACRALAVAKSVDEAKKIRDVNEALRVYARQAKNKQLEIDASAIRFRAERRIGELMETQRKTIGLNDGGRPKKTRSNSDPVSKPTLAEAGIDKHLADRARKLAAIPEEKFDGLIHDWKERAEKENERVTIKLLHEGQQHAKQNGSEITIARKSDFQRDLDRVAESVGTLLDNCPKDKLDLFIVTIGFYVSAAKKDFEAWKQTISA